MATYDNENMANYTSSPAPSKGLKAAVWIVSIALVGLLTYTIVDKNNTGTTIQQQQTTIAKVTDEKSEIQKSFDASLVRLDSMASIKTSLESKLTESNNEITKEKAEIRSILNKKNLTAAELSKAKSLVAQLNGKITDMEQQIATLTQQNQSLTQDKAALTQDKEKLTQDLATTTTAKDELAKKVDVASTLNASNIVITPVKVKGNGEQKVTTTAKRVDKLMVSFDVDNRIAEPGQTDVYVVVIGPDGKPIADSSMGTFTTREDGDKSYSAKVPVVIETAKKKNVEFGITPTNRFVEGSYTIQIYQNGFKIGEATRELKKGGLFS